MTEQQRDPQKRPIQLVGQFSKLLDISVNLNSTLDLNQLLNRILNTATDVLNCEAASIMLFDEKRGELIFTATTDPNARTLTQIPVPLDGSIAGTIFKERRQLRINDVRNDPRHYENVSEQVDFIPESLLGIPLTIRDRTIGVLEALNKKEGGFTQDDGRLLAIIGSQAAVAINNAQLHQALRKAFDEVSRVDKLKSNFMALASHELRTPLGIILGYASFLKDEAEGTLSEHAGAVFRAAIQLQTIVEDLTNMNFIQIGTLELKTEPQPIQRIVAKAYKQIADAAHIKDQLIKLDIDQELIFIETEASKLELVFLNLLNNAIRFTPRQGTITIRVFSKNYEAWVEIEDTGIGIPEDELEYIFDDFYQVEDHLTRRFEGLGLGLSIAKGLVELHKGRIWAGSKGQGKGSKFTVVIPQTEA